MAAVPRFDQTSALSRAPYVAVAELTGTAAQGRILLAAPITQAEIERHFADQIETADEIFVRSWRDGVAGAAQEDLARDHAVGGAIGAKTLGGNRPRAGDGLISPALINCRASKPSKQWRDRVTFLRAAEAEASQNPWPDLSDAALARSARHGWCLSSTTSPR